MSEQETRAVSRSFRTCAQKVAQLLGIDAAAATTGPPSARRLAAAVRKPLLERAVLPEELFDPLMAAAVYDPDPSFCRWFVEPAIYVFGCRRVREALLEYLRTGTEAERAGAVRAWYSTTISVREGRSPAYPPGTTRDAALDESRDVVDAWRQARWRSCATSQTRGRANGFCGCCRRHPTPTRRIFTTCLKAHSQPPGPTPTRTPAAGSPPLIATVGSKRTRRKTRPHTANRREFTLRTVSRADAGKPRCGRRGRDGQRSSSVPIRPRCVPVALVMHGVEIVGSSGTSTGAATAERDHVMGGYDEGSVIGHVDDDAGLFGVKTPNPVSSLSPC